MILKYNNIYKIQDILAVAGFTRQAFYKAKHSKTASNFNDNQVQEIVKLARLDGDNLGARTIFSTYDVTFMGVNKFEQTVSKLGLGVKYKKKFKVKTTDGKYEVTDVNLIQGLVLYKPRQVISGDITYFYSLGKLYYIFTLKDNYSGRVLGLYASNSLKAENAIIVLKQALAIGSIADYFNTIHHTDGGSQYKSFLYRQLLGDSKMLQSIAGSCFENGMAEQFNGLIKNDYLEFKHVDSLKKLNAELDLLKIFLNEKRTMESLGNRTPVEFEKAMLALPEALRMKKEMFNFEAKKIETMKKIIENGGTGRHKGN